MIHEVRVYDKNGKLKDRFMPVFNYEPQTIGNQSMKTCPECGTKKLLKGNARFCSVACKKAHRTKRDKRLRAAAKLVREARPIVPCEVCGNPVTGKRVRYCGEICDKNGRKMKAMNKADAVKKLIKIRKAELENEKH